VSEGRDRSLLLLLTGAFAVWLGVSGKALDYVRPGMRPYVLAAGAVAVLLALAPPGGLLARSPVSGDHDHHHDHAHAHRIGVGWLLVLPLLVAVVVPPRPLGASAVRARRVASASGAETVFPPLARPVGGAVPMTMAEFSTRALRDRDRSLTGVRVRLTGFVSAAPAGGAYRLGRFVIFCCAADAEALEVTGVWVPGPGEVPRLRADGARPVPRPAKPYEFTVVWSG
jgi:uncharacterized repeat protein (TIGR03943 family)